MCIHSYIYLFVFATKTNGNVKQLYYGVDNVGNISLSLYVYIYRERDTHYYYYY